LGWTNLSLPLGIALADGTTATAIAEDLMLPLIQTVVLTNSTGNQTTATLPCGEVTIGVLTGRPKGTARIQVAVDVDYKGETVVTVQEVGGTARKLVNIRNIL
jgi:hypothetical protein